MFHMELIPKGTNCFKVVDNTVVSPFVKNPSSVLVCPYFSLVVDEQDDRINFHNGYCAILEEEIRDCIKQCNIKCSQ